ncbi:MAG: ABC transporter ATP-binding protein [Caldilineaceae bacterium]
MRPEETLGRFPHQLSGGQRQRVMVARALILRPKIILADEPVSMIDASLRATVLGSLQRLKEEFGISIIYITHDLTTAYQIGDNIIVLYRGSVAEAGSVDLVVRRPNHPYTQLLVNSIPVPNPDQPWAAEQGLRWQAKSENGVPAALRTAVHRRWQPVCNRRRHFFKRSRSAPLPAFSMIRRQFCRRRGWIACCK